MVESSSHTTERHFRHSPQDHLHQDGWKMSGPDSARDDTHPVDLGDGGTTTPSPHTEVHAYLEPFLGPADEVLLAVTDPLPDPNPVIAEFTHQVELSIDPNGIDLKMGVNEKGP